MKKENKIKSIPLYLPVSEHKINYKEYKDNIYFLGNEQMIRPELSLSATTFSAIKDLHPINPNCTNSSQGARMEDVFKLIPRSDSVTRANNFTSYHSFFQFFDRVLGTTHTNVLRGKSKQFGFETSTKKNFLLLVNRYAGDKRELLNSFKILVIILMIMTFFPNL